MSCGRSVGSNVVRKGDAGVGIPKSLQRENREKRRVQRARSSLALRRRPWRGESSIRTGPWSSIAGALRAQECRPNMFRATISRGDPYPHLPRRVMPHMLGVTALEIGDPLVLLVTVVPNDSLKSHRNSCARCVNGPTCNCLNRRPTIEMAAPSFSTRPCTSTNGARFTTSSFGATNGCGTTTFI